MYQTLVEQYDSVLFSEVFHLACIRTHMCIKICIFNIILFSVNRGIPPWDSANTLYIMREEVQGTPAAVLVFCTICIHIFTFFQTVKNNETDLI